MQTEKKVKWIDENSTRLKNEYTEFEEIRKKINPEKASLRITVIYMIFGSLWILLSDKILDFLVKNQEIYKEIQLFKGWFYVFATGAIFFLLINQSLRLYKRSIDYVIKGYHEINQTYEELMAMNEELSSQYLEVEKKKNELQVSEQRYQLIVEGSSDGIWDWDIVNDIYIVSDKWKALFGYNPVEIGNTMYSWERLFFQGDWEKIKVIIDEYLQKKTGFYEATFRIKEKHGGYRWIYSRGKAVWDENGKPIRFAGSHTDITERKNMESKLETLAYYNRLTGLPNRSLFEKEIVSYLQENTKFALVNLDIDDLKHINDMYGQEAGDRYIRYIADILKTEIHFPDFIAHISGDQFIILMMGEQLESDISHKIDYIFSRIRKPWVIEEGTLRISASAGIALYPEHGEDCETLIKNAEIAMYKHKDGGKDGYTFFQPIMYENTLKTIQMNAKLREAVENKMFQLYYQPQIDLKTQDIIGVEALIRWQHPVDGFISPMEFIPLSEKNGLIIPITMWTMETAINQIRIWEKNKQQPLKVAVNLSGNIIIDDLALENICNLFDTLEVRPGEIEIEVTETAVMMDLDKAKASLERLRSYGISIAMDDFGTGYSSLTYLQKLPLDYLKIDREFIINVQKEDEDSYIYKSVIDLAHNMDLQVVAEGIETKEQRDFLVYNGCDIAQGYFFAKPMPVPQLEALLLTYKK